MSAALPLPALPLPARPAPAARRIPPPETRAMLRPMPDTARLHREAVQFRILLGLTYPLFLAAAVAQRLRSPARPALAPRRTVFGEARAMAAQAVPFAFMG
ncbi:hypothetical protein BHAOGJBA_2710 [Methylobacterium hispanicum]|uniref:Uncharacterized protein n=2 Tax=Methylobacterium hispanicum TaxID=270350 RepID=A0AAV4ZM67_9HYPH|nr:hypothetical protein BHAOGJBA_2710 [Methylobacterium hispanicum]